MKIVYCNDPAASLCQTSVKRLVNKISFADLIAFAELPFPFTEASAGFSSPSPYVETEFKLLKIDKAGKVQLAVYPMGEGDARNWVFIAHDVTLEEALHSKYRTELSQKEGYIAELEQARAKLEDYSKNLEKLVEQRTVELRRANENLNAVLDSLGQGFLTFDAQGKAGNVYTRACLDVLETNPQGQNIKSVLKVPAAKNSEFEMWLKALFSEALPFDELKPLGPNLAPHSKGRYITLDYYPIRSEGKIRDVVAVATDKTAEREAQIALENERQYAAMVIKYTKNKEQFLQFLQSATVVLKQIDDIAAKPFGASEMAESFRLLHTLEGESGTFSIMNVRLASRVSQQVLEPFKGKATMPADVQTKYVATLKELRAELEKFLIENSDLIKVPKAGVGRLLEMDASAIRGFSVWMEKNGVASSVVREFEDRFLAEPVEKRFTHYDGLVQNVADKLGKKVKPLRMIGGDTLIHPEPYAALFASLVHIFRNAVDHGIEPADERTWVEKDEAGQIMIEFKKDGSRFKMTISDDGQGIDPASIRKKLATTHPELQSKFAAQSDDEVIQNIFLPGFSSKESIGEFSGRGIGMDAVREEVGKLGGSVKVYSQAGKGSRFEFDFPVIELQIPHARSA